MPEPPKALRETFSSEAGNYDLNEKVNGQKRDEKKPLGFI